MERVKGVMKNRTYVVVVPLLNPSGGILDLVKNCEKDKNWDKIFDSYFEKDTFEKVFLRLIRFMRINKSFANNFLEPCVGEFQTSRWLWTIVNNHGLVNADIDYCKGGIQLETQGSKDDYLETDHNRLKLGIFRIIKKGCSPLVCDSLDKDKIKLEMNDVQKG